MGKRKILRTPCGSSESFLQFNTAVTTSIYTNGAQKLEHQIKLQNCRMIFYRQTYNGCATHEWPRNRLDHRITVAKATILC